MPYKINHTDDYDIETNKAEGQTFRNKDEVIDYLILHLAMICSNHVEVIKK